jgi:hypothetical protein
LLNSHFRVRAVAAAEEEPEDVLLERRPRRIKKIAKKEDIKEIAKKNRASVSSMLMALISRWLGSWLGSWLGTPNESQQKSSRKQAAKTTEKPGNPKDPHRSNWLCS